MQIGYDVTPLAPPRTGVGNYAYSLLRALMEADTSLSYSLFSSGRHPADLEGLPEVASWEDTADLLMHRHVRLPTRLLYKIWDNLGRPRVDRMLEGVDIYHATNYYLPPVQEARRITTIYDLSFLKNPAWSSPKIVGPFSEGVRRFAHEADAIITCSEATKVDAVTMLGVHPEKVHVVYGAVDSSFGDVQRPEAVDLLVNEYDLRQPFLLYVGTLEPRKNIRGLLRAFAAVAQDVPHTLVLVGGVGWNMDGLDEEIESLGIADRVRRMGYLPRRNHLPAFYAAADAFFFPSFYEGFGLPVLEAMTCGCPVITSDTSSLPEVGGEAARYVSPDDEDHMAGTLLKVLTNERLRDSMSTLGFARAEKFGWDRSADRTLDVYRSLA
jgi:glycosyltransferase involved in cell wall biosynthesis